MISGRIFISGTQTQQKHKKMDHTAIPAWKIASDKIKQAEKNSKEYYAAYAEYYEALIESDGDGNGYYYGEMKRFQELAK
jgi:hypothetical protein